MGGSPGVWNMRGQISQLSQKSPTEDSMDSSSPKWSSRNRCGNLFSFTWNFWKEQSHFVLKYSGKLFWIAWLFVPAIFLQSFACVFPVQVFLSCEFCFVHGFLAERQGIQMMWQQFNSGHCRLRICLCWIRGEHLDPTNPQDIYSRIFRPTETETGTHFWNRKEVVKSATECEGSGPSKILRSQRPEYYQLPFPGNLETVSARVCNCLCGACPSSCHPGQIKLEQNRVT